MSDQDPILLILRADKVLEATPNAPLIQLALTDIVYIRPLNKLFRPVPCLCEKCALYKMTPEDDRYLCESIPQTSIIGNHTCGFEEVK